MATLTPPRSNRRSRSGTVSLSHFNNIDAGNESTPLSSVNIGRSRQRSESERRDERQNEDWREYGDFESERDSSNTRMREDILADEQELEMERQRQEEFQALVVQQFERERRLLAFPTQSSVGGVARKKKWLVLVVPPDTLPHSPPLPPTSGFARGFGSPGRFNGGILLPLEATLPAQVQLIAREFSLPSIAGICLYLCLPSTTSTQRDSTSSYYGESGSQYASTPTSTRQHYPEEIGKPRLTEETWSILWCDYLEGSRFVGPQSGAGGLPIAGRIEFDIDPRRARWLPAWLDLPTESAPKDTAVSPRSSSPATRRFGSSRVYSRPDTPSWSINSRSVSRATTARSRLGVEEDEDEAVEPENGIGRSLSRSSFRQRPLSLLSHSSSVPRTVESPVGTRFSSRLPTPFSRPSSPPVETPSCPPSPSNLFLPPMISEQTELNVDETVGDISIPQDVSTRTRSSSNVFSFPRPTTVSIGSSDDSFDQRNPDESTLNWTIELDRLREVSEASLLDPTIEMSELELDGQNFVEVAELHVDKVESPNRDEDKDQDNETKQSAASSDVEKDPSSPSSVAEYLQEPEETTSPNSSYLTLASTPETRLFDIDDDLSPILPSCYPFLRLYPSSWPSLVVYPTLAPTLTPLAATTPLNPPDESLLRDRSPAHSPALLPDSTRSSPTPNLFVLDVDGKDKNAVQIDDDPPAPEKLAFDARSGTDESSIDWYLSAHGPPSDPSPGSSSFDEGEGEDAFGTSDSDGEDLYAVYEGTMLSVIQEETASHSMTAQMESARIAALKQVEEVPEEDEEETEMHDETDETRQMDEPQAADIPVITYSNSSVSSSSDYQVATVPPHDEFNGLPSPLPSPTITPFRPFPPEPIQINEFDDVYDFEAEESTGELPYIPSPGLQHALGLDDSPEILPVSFPVDEIESDGSSSDDGSQYRGHIVAMDDEQGGDDSCQTFDHLTSIDNTLSRVDQPPVLFTFSSSDSSDFAAALAQFVIEAQIQSIERRGKFTICLDGGILPKLLGSALVKDERVVWNRWEVFFVKQDLVGSDASQRRFDELFSRVPIPAPNVHSIDISSIDTTSPDRGGLVEQLAWEYEEEIAEIFPDCRSSGEVPRFDMVLIYLPIDGSTNTLAASQDLWVGSTFDNKTHPSIAITSSLLHSARRLAFLALGADKEPTLADILVHSVRLDNEDKLPAARIALEGHPVVYFADEAAVGEIEYPKTRFWEEGS